MNGSRTDRVVRQMKARGLDSLLVSDPSAIFYLTGTWMHPGERLLVLYLDAGGSHRLFNNALFPLADGLGLDIVWYDDTQDAVEKIAPFLRDSGVAGIDKNWPARFLLRLQELKGAVRYVDGSALVDTVRMRKDAEERERMRAASRINDLAMGRLVERVSACPEERRAARELEGIYEDLGAECFSFAPIVAYGPNGADPHHTPDASRLEAGDSVILDIGCVKDSYCSDMTRTFFYREASGKAREVYALVREANERGIAAVRPGARFRDVDAAARDTIEAAGYGRYFTHRTGHSIGIDVHEYGDVSAVNAAVLEEGMVFSVEPGVYLPGEFGVRIEDLVLVTRDGCEVLNRYGKDLTVIG